MHVDDFDRFAWESARPETAEVMDDWWIPVSEDAPERTEALIDMAFGQRKVYAVNPDMNREKQEALLPEMPETLGFPVQMGMIKTGEGIAARGVALMEEPSIQDALSELWEIPVDGEREEAERWRSANAIAEKHSVSKEDMRLMWHWSDKTGALAYYSRPEVQEAIYSYVQGRCIRMEGTEEYLTLSEPQDVFGLAAYMVGGGVTPSFRCTNARYGEERGEMIACDMVIKVKQELGKSVALLLRGFDMPSFVLYSGGEYMWIVIPFEVLEAGANLKSPLKQLPDLAIDVTKHLRRMLQGNSGVSVSLYEDSAPILYSLADGGERVNLPVKLEDVARLSPDAARLDAVNTIEEMGSFIPPDAGEKAAKFFNDVIL